MINFKTDFESIEIFSNLSWCTICRLSLESLWWLLWQKSKQWMDKGHSWATHRNSFFLLKQPPSHFIHCLIKSVMSLDSLCLGNANSEFNRRCSFMKLPLKLYYYFVIAAVTVGSSHTTVSSSALWSRFSPPSNFVNGHRKVIGRDPICAS